MSQVVVRWGIGLVIVTVLLIGAAQAVGAALPYDGEIAFDGTTEGQRDIYVVDVARGLEWRLTHQNQANALPAWSPDGNQIAFISSGDDFAIFTMNADGRNIRKLSHGDIAHASPSWSPDGNQIAFTGASYKNFDVDSEVYIMDIASGNERQMTNNNSYEQSPRWSPDGKLLGFLSDYGGFWSLYTMYPDGTHTHRLTDYPYGVFAFTWSPDGKQLALGDASGRIYVMNADGSAIHAVTNSQGRDMLPDWSPDGTRIAFISTRDGTSQIYVMNTDGSDVQQLTHSATEKYAPVWRPK